MLARFPPAAPTPVHNHNSWGVICVIRGRDRHILWAREDDGSQPGRAQLRMVESRELGPGDIAWFPDAPADIHSQQGIGADAWELVYFARDPTTGSRLYFDPERERVEERAPV
jgi:predicted metal-dependent enzyme (double-stranded beta helix superfamily)